MPRSVSAECMFVAPLTGSVDRNIPRSARALSLASVAPLTGSVDRNQCLVTEFVYEEVAPLTGSVDRNQPKPVSASGHWLSLPSRGAWIEMVNICPLVPPSGRSLPSRGAWIEMSRLATCPRRNPRSLPSRGAWIEISDTALRSACRTVAPLAGSVDRNLFPSVSSAGLRRGVAPLAGSVDRNLCTATSYLSPTRVAPLTGSVDRNILLFRFLDWLSRRSPHGERG